MRPADLTPRAASGFLSAATRHHCAVPVSGVDVWVPAASVTLSVAGPFAPAGSVAAVVGANRTVMKQLFPGARVVWPISWPLAVGPQVDVNRKTGKSAALVPEIVPCVIPVSATFP